MNAKWITPAVTAMDEHGHIDMEANGRIYDYLIENGMDGILLLGASANSSPFPPRKRGSSCATPSAGSTTASRCMPAQTR